MSWLSRLTNAFRRSRVDRELDEEQRFHLDARIDALIEQGLSRKAAEDEAVRRFGNRLLLRQQSRDVKVLSPLDNVLQDLRYALRQVRKQPGVAALVVLILGLSIGANIVVFSALEVLVLRALPVGEPEQLVLLRSARTAPNGTPIANDWVSYDTYAHIRDHARSLSGVLALNGSRNLRTLIPGGFGRSEPLQATTSDVSGNYFSLLQIAPALGRLLAADDDRREAPRAVAVLSYAFWQREFGADTRIIGKPVQIENVIFEIVGVAPPGFSGVKVGEPVDVWTPLEMMPMVSPRIGSSLHQPDWFGLIAMARLRPDITRAAAAAEIRLLHRQVGAAMRPRNSAGEHARAWGTMELERGASGFGNEMRSRAGPMLGIVLVVVTLIQMVTCANVASLSLARLASRRRELAARTALGAGRGRLLAQLVTESLVLVGGGVLLGLLMMWWGFSIARSYRIDAQPSPGILFFVLLMSSVTGLIVAVIPALTSTRIDLSSALKSEAGSATGRSRQVLQKALVVVQIAVSGCLLAGTGQFVRTVQNLQKVDVGFSTVGLLLLEVETPRDDAGMRQAVVRDELTQAVAMIPGVRHVTFSEHALLNDTITQARITVPGYVDVPGEDMTVQFASVGPDFFDTLGIPVLRGHGLFAKRLPGTRETGSIMVVSEALVRRFFSGADPLGRVIQRGGSQYEIVGVAKNTKYRNLRDDAELVCYIPQGHTPSPRIGFQIRTSGDSRTVAGAIPAIVRRIDPKVHVRRVETIEASLERATREDRMVAACVGGFSVLAMLLTSLGLYGLLAFDIGQRVKEIGVRIVLGGRSDHIIALVFK
jgi:predicted permease